MFGHSSWDTFRATTTSGNQVFHGFWDRISSETIDKWEVVNPEQCGETPLKVVVYVKEKRFGGDKGERFHYAKMYIWDDLSETEVQESDDDDEDDDATGGWKLHKISKEKNWPLKREEREGFISLVSPSSPNGTTKPVDPWIADWAFSNGLVYEGCTDSNAVNFDEDATCDDGSCECKDGYQKNDDGICEEIPPAEEEIVAQGTATSVDGGAGYVNEALLVGGVALVGILIILNRK